MANTNFINECKNRANANRLGKIKIEGETTSTGNILSLSECLEKNINKLSLYGRCEQKISPSPDNPSEIKCIKGINLLKGLSIDVYDSTYWNNLNRNYFTALEDGWGRWEVDNTSGTSTIFANAMVNLSAIDLKPSTTYTFVVEIRNSTISENSNAYLQIITNNASGAFKTGRLIGYQDINENKKIVFNSVTKDSFNGVTRGVDTYLRLGAGTKGTVEARISLFEYGNNISSTYVPYNTIQVKNNGKNLFDGIFELGIINGSTGQNGSSSNIDYIRNKNYIPVKELTKYKFSSPDYTGTSVFVYEYKADFSYNLALNKTIPLSSYLTTNKDTKYIRFRPSIASTDTNMRFQLEEGIQATEYEQYKENIINIDLKGNELCSLPNNVKDELLIENGRAKIIKNVGKVVLNGSEVWKRDTTNQFYSLIIKSLVKASSVLISNYFEYSGGWRETDGIFIGETGAMGLINTKVDNVSDLITWLSTHNTIVYYELVTTIEIDLGAIEQPKTFEGVNNISNSEDTDMSVIYSNWNKMITNSDNLQNFEIDSGCYINGNIIGSVYVKCLKVSLVADTSKLADKNIQAQIGVKYANLSNEYINMGKNILPNIKIAK